VKEYSALGDEEEAARCWRDLDVSFFGHQLVFSILLAAFEMPSKEDLLLHLIRRFEASGEVSQVPPPFPNRREFNSSAILPRHSTSISSTLSPAHDVFSQQCALRQGGARPQLLAHSYLQKHVRASESVVCQARRGKTATRAG
jgi:hypothetical protein